MVLALPPTTKALANTMVVFLTTPPASPSGIPTVTEVNAGLVAQCFIYGQFNPTRTRATGEGPTKLCSDSSPTEAGRRTYEAATVQGSYMPQELGTPGADGNELYEALEPDTQVTAVVLMGIDGKTDAVVANDIADVYLMDVIERTKGMTGEGDFDKMSFTATLLVVDGEIVAEDHKLAAS